MATISPTPKLQFLDANGDPLSYGLLYTYAAGTTFPAVTYTTAAQTTANTNPIVLDARGEANVWLTAGSAYKFVLQNSSGVLQYTVDQLTAAGTMSTQNANAVAITGGTISGVSISGPITGNITGNVVGDVSGNLSGNVVGGTVSATSYNGGQLAGMRNVVVNGDMSISQRGVSWAGVGASNSIYLDRWLYYNNTDAVVSISGSGVSYPPNSPFTNLNAVSVTTADASLGASQHAYIQQTLLNATNTLVDNTFTLSFWVRSSAAGVYSATFRNYNVGTGLYDTIIRNFTVSASNTWEYKTIVITDGLTYASSLWSLLFVLAAGSSYNNGIDNVWSSTNDITTSDQVNFFATNGNNFYVTGVQIELGSVATPFEFLSPGVNEYLCQRDYQTVGTAGTPDFRYTFYANGAVTYYLPVVWPTLMSTTPTVTVSGTWSNTNVTTLTPSDPTRRGCALAIAATGAGTTTISNGATDGRLVAATGY